MTTSCEKCGRPIADGPAMSVLGFDKCGTRAGIADGVGEDESCSAIAAAYQRGRAAADSERDAAGMVAISREDAAHITNDEIGIGQRNADGTVRGNGLSFDGNPDEWDAYERIYDALREHAKKAGA